MGALSMENIPARGNIISKPKIWPIGELLWMENSTDKGSSSM